MSGRSAVSRLDVLLVEDNPDDARLVEWAFSESSTSHGQSSRSAPDTIDDGPLLDRDCLSSVTRLSEALDHIDRQSPDVVLLDLDLPDSRGIETLERFTSQTPPIPVIVLTGRDEDELGLAAIQRGAQEYLYKGDLTNKLLVRTIRYAVERHDIQHRLRNMTDRLRLTNEVVRRQLRNDISVIIGQADQLAESDRYADRSVDSILDAALDIETTIDITSEFTESALTEDGMVLSDDLDAIVSMAINRVEQSTGTSIDRTYNSGTTSHGHPPSLQVAITHILHDAVDRSSPSGTTSITTETINGNTVISITNTGEALEPHDVTLLTADNDQDITTPRGTVGVRLASMILSMNEITVSVRENTPSGSVIRLDVGGASR